MTAVQRPRVASLLVAAFGLTAREQDVAHSVLCGATTKEISQALFVSPHTVQEHLKAIFEMTGVHSRRELVSVFFSLTDTTTVSATTLFAASNRTLLVLVLAQGFDQRSLLRPSWRRVQPEPTSGHTDQHASTRY